MTTYANGLWPETLFQVYATGKDEDGPWKHLVTAGTRAKIEHLKTLAHARTGQHLNISPGWSCYRPIPVQRAYRAKYGTGAAYPGTSSHGINWLDGDRGWRVCLAIDFHNWGQIYGWNRKAWYDDCREAGLTPGLIHPSRGNGYPDEPWHVIDLDPFATPPQPTPTEGDSEMYIQWKDDPAKVVYAVATELAQPSMRACGKGEAAIARAAGRVTMCDEGTLTLMATEAGYQAKLRRTDVGRTIASAVWNGEVIKRAGGTTSVLQELANIGTATTAKS